MTSFLLAAVLGAPAADAGVRDATVRIAVSPAAIPKPALKYQLLPEARELKSGNPTQWYLRCFAEQRNFFFTKQAVADRARYRTMPLKNLPAQDLRNYGGNALTQADWAARLDTPDWQVRDKIESEGADIRLPELDPLRELAIGLQVRFRGEVARGDFKDAIRTAKTMFAFARHLGEYPLLAANRLGLAVEEMALDTLTEMIQQPNCPNLYWALTDLPCPLVDLRKGAQGDNLLAEAELRLLDNEKAMTDTELEEIVSRLSGRVGFAREQAGKPPRNLRGALTARAKDLTAVRAARSRLIDSGVDKETIASFPALQVILLDEKLAYETRRDDEMKLLSLKLWEIPSGGAKKAESGGLFADLLPCVGEVRREAGKLEQRIAVLRCVEALRMFAAAHDGKLPGKLAEIGRAGGSTSEIEVPLPVDPFTGKPFEYALNTSTATLTLLKGEEKETRFEIVINK